MMQEKAFGMGYVIIDAQGRIQYHTLRTNRAECWQAFGVTAKLERDKWKRRGFRCEFVTLEQKR